MAPPVKSLFFSGLPAAGRGYSRFYFSFKALMNASQFRVRLKQKKASAFRLGSHFQKIEGAVL